jgi:hypothetical protein
MQLSNSWLSPERSERLAQLAGSGKQDARSMIAMQYDQTTLFAAKLKTMFSAPGMAQPLKQAIAALPAAEQAKAREALSRLMAFDGKLSDLGRRGAVRAVPAGEHPANLPRQTGPGVQRHLEGFYQQQQPVVLGSGRSLAGA